MPARCLIHNERTEKIMTKRRYKSRAVSRRRERLVVYLLVAVVLVLVFVVLSLTVLFHLDHFSVTGELAYTQEEIVEATGLTGGENLLRLNTKEVERTILARLPYLETAEVTVALPDTLEIVCTPAEEYAYAAQDGRYWILDRQGRVLAEKATAPTHLLLLSGVAPPEQTLNQNADEEERTYITFDDSRTADAFSSLAKQLEGMNMGKVTRINMPSYLDISFVVEERVRIRLGTVVDMEYKMRYVARLFEEGEIPETEMAVVDASNTGRVSLKANPSAGLTEADILG